MKPSEVLEAARDLIKDPQKWAHGVNEALYVDKKLCALQAIGAVKGNIADTVRRRARAALSLAVAGTDYNPPARIATWNDVRDRTHSEILAGFDTAIELAKEIWKDSEP